MLSTGDQAPIFSVLLESATETASSFESPIFQDLSTLSLSPIHQVSQISKCILSAHTSLSRMSDLLRHAALRKSVVDAAANPSSDSYVDDTFWAEYSSLIRRQAVIGKAGFSEYRLRFQSLLNGAFVPTRKYKYRVDTDQIRSAIEYICCTLGGQHSSG